MGSREEGYNVSDTGNWNVASDYSRIKIMKPLDFCDHYENIARFGYDTLIEEIENYGVPLDELKLIGFSRLINELIKICGNVKFAMKGSTSKTLEDLKNKFIEIRSLTSALSKTIKKQKKRIVVLNNNYYKTLDIIIGLKAELNEPLNQNHLIFTNKEEFDPKEHKKKIMEEAKTRG